MKSLHVECHPEKTWLGKVQQGFDFLGFRISPTTIQPSMQSVSRRDSKLAQLYGQGADQKRIGQYLRRWSGWDNFSACIGLCFVLFLSPSTHARDLMGEVELQNAFDDVACFNGKHQDNFTSTFSIDVDVRDLNDGIIVLDGVEVDYSNDLNDLDFNQCTYYFTASVVTAGAGALTNIGYEVVTLDPIGKVSGRLSLEFDDARFPARGTSTVNAVAFQIHALLNGE